MKKIPNINSKTINPSKISNAKKRRLLRLGKKQLNNSSITKIENSIITPQKVPFNQPPSPIMTSKTLHDLYKEYTLFHAETANQLPNFLKKFWKQRYNLFSKYDEGIFLDQESWYSVTPEPIAQHIALTCKHKIVIDAFCGSGGNAIQFALHCDKAFDLTILNINTTLKVIAIDIDPQKIFIAQNNARVYNVLHKIDFICGDFLKIADTLFADVVFLSPPWGGVGYISEPVYSLSMIQPIDGVELFNKAKSISESVIYFLPKNTSLEEIVDLSNGKKCKIEQNYLYNSLKSITFYYNVQNF
ncbi:hypothetical protein BB559_000677 [Furculomyces boomerangus]|uniref:Trimethylguanosine synthase n=2 Tax=Harpellales TaxID=61421 RepID=A0A2T9Z4M1_9FUNG|nr:hypothetical protein BB559_000677 [Furculomyces boomerangus]PVZ99639.1 hypothetical protein BB558_004324 [Smittium angustum]